MSDTSKRQLDASADSSQSKRPETASTTGSSTRKGNKPGRKPLETEPKNKRTAQNRAAQRAFRERKERKMRELEEKIQELENEKKNAYTESEFLRLQVQTLMAELAKHRGTTDISDLQLPVFNKAALPTGGLTETSSSSTDLSSTFSPSGSEATLKSLSDIVNPEGSTTSAKTPQFAFEFPWSRKGSIQINSGLSASGNTASVPPLAPDGSTSSSSSSSNSPLDVYETPRDLPMFHKKDKANEQEFNFNEQFDEGVSEFCNDLSSACGTKDRPVPKVKSVSGTPAPEIKTAEDPLAFLSDPNLDYNFGSFDPSLAFGNDNSLDLFGEEKPEVDPLAQITTEESIYDPFGMFAARRASAGPQQTSQQQQQPVKADALLGTVTYTTTASAGADNDSDAEVVPNTEGRLLKCTEIWDRITSHPKYADIDIDGLCSELRAKAKCSDKGVVIDYSDVNRVIMNNVPEK